MQRTPANVTDCGTAQWIHGGTAVCIDLVQLPHISVNVTFCDVAQMESPLKLDEFGQRGTAAYPPPCHFLRVWTDPADLGDWLKWSVDPVKAGVVDGQ